MGNPTTQQSNTKKDKMDVTIKGYDDNLFMIEVGVDDTTETMRQKVASAVGLAEDSFRMGFGGKDEGEDITQLSAGDTIILTKTTKYAARAELHALGETDITAERLEDVEDPEVACLLLQAEVATVIPDEFLSGSSLTRLDLSAVSCVTEVGDGFLISCATLTSIDLSGMSKVTHIGSCFLDGCEGLTTLDLSPLSGLTEIGSCFLYRCKGLTTLDLSPLSNLTAIGDNFLEGCEGLTTLDLSPLSGLTAIGDNFLYGCEGLTTLDLSPLSNLTAIGHNFLYRCKGLTTLDLSPLSNLTAIGDNFLDICKGLTTLDLSPLSRVKVVGRYFLTNCTSLKSIHLTGCSSAVSDAVVKCKLSKLVVESRPKRSRESPHQAHKRQRAAQ